MYYSRNTLKYTLSFQNQSDIEKKSFPEIAQM